jgi:ABC-type polysaccharide/polyol phosphate transport system ATPase subunit
MTEPLVKVDGISKKFCRNLKRSLWYGVKDLGNELVGRRHGGNGKLRRDEFWAVKDVQFEVMPGECIGLIGHNGAGKTTLLRMLNGLIKPDSGRIEMRGRVGALIALGAGFNPVLTGRENIYISAAVHGLTKKQTDAKIDDIVEFAELGEFIDAPVQSYSSGMAVRLGFAVAVNTEPDILLLDEVLAVGDMAFQTKCLNAIAEFRRRGTAFILVSHNMHSISRYADQVLYLEKGHIAHIGDSLQGVERYLADMHQADRGVESGLTDWSLVHGSGKVVFTRARFRNASGDQVTAIETGEPVTLEIDYERYVELDEPPVLDVGIRDREGIVYQGTSESGGMSLGKLSRKGCFRVNFEELPLNSDYVDFAFAALDRSTNEVMDWKRHVRLWINRRGAQLGRIRLHVTWSVHASEVELSSEQPS